jgi:hypothetical protein
MITAPIFYLVFHPVFTVQQNSSAQIVFHDTIWKSALLNTVTNATIIANPVMDLPPLTA